MRAWLRYAEPGVELRRHCAAEALLLDAAAARLNAIAEQDLREIGGALGQAADRLRRLIGAAEEE